MRIPLVAYFAGMGTVTAALAVGFVGAIAVLDANTPTKIPAAAFGMPMPKEPEPLTPLTVSDVTASIEALKSLNQPISAAQLVLNALAFAPPTSSADVFKSTELIRHAEPASVIQAVRKVHPKPKVRPTRLAVQSLDKGPERRTVERRKLVTDELKIIAYAPVGPREPDFFRALFGL
jgi:hypothetical protein